MTRAELMALVDKHTEHTVIQGVVVMAAGIFVIINMLVDIVFILIDPRVDYSGEGGH